MADLTHPDSDWAALGTALIDRKPFKRLERPTPQQVAAAKEILGIHKSPPKRTRGPNGRPKKQPNLMKAAALRKQGLSWDEVAKALGVHRNTLLVKRKEAESRGTMEL